MAARPAVPAQRLRIIGGQWRGRRIAITTAAAIRPTPDRVRETLFNWLAPRLAGARCLDLFAGTGALGLEALSRGAQHATFIERDGTAAQALRDTLAVLACTEARVCHGDALARMRQLETGFDVVFIDPPFATDLHLHLAALAASRPLLKPDARVYLEYPWPQAAALGAALAPDWRRLRHKRAGRVGYDLLTLSEYEP